MAVFSGLYESPGPPPSVDARGIVPPHRDDYRNGHQSGYMIHRCFVCCRPGGRQPPRRYGASSRPMAASSGFWCSPGHAASGDAACIASKPHHGHQHGPQRMGISLPPPPIPLGIIVAKDHVMVH
jgi:hypothetical protein